MGFLLFAYRKLSLKRQINDLTYQSMCLQQQKEDITRQIGDAQQNISNQKSIFSMSGAMAMAKVSQDIFGSYANAQNDPRLSDPQKAGEVQKEMYVKQMQYQMAQQAAAMTNNAMNTIFEGQSKVQLAQLAAVDKQIDMKIANNDSQLALLKAEEQSVEKGEAEEAKQAAPKFGLS